MGNGSKKWEQLECSLTEKMAEEGLVGHIFNEVGMKREGVVVNSKPGFVLNGVRYRIIEEEEVNKVWNGRLKCEDRSGRLGFFEPYKFGIGVFEGLVGLGMEMVWKEKVGEGCYKLDLEKGVEGEGDSKGGKTQQKEQKLEKVNPKDVEKLLKSDTYWAFSTKSRFPNWKNFQLTALYPVGEESIQRDPCKTSTLFYKRQLEEIKKKIEESYQKGENPDKKVLMIVGDFWGIQSFIFRRLSIKGAPKMLRSRSAYVELLSYFLSWRLATEFDGFVIRAAAGQFTVIGPVKKSKNWREELSRFEEGVNSYFRKHFFGLNGLMLKGFEVEFDEIDDGIFLEELASGEEKAQLQKRMGLTEKIRMELERAKSQKFYDDLFGKGDNVIDIFENAATDDDICALCHARPGKRLNRYEKKELGMEENEEIGRVCPICFTQIKLGKFLSNDNYKYVVITKEELPISEQIKLIEIADERWFLVFTKNYRNAKCYYDISRKEDSVIFYISEKPKEIEWPFLPIKSYIPVGWKKIKEKVKEGEEEKEREREVLVPLSFEEIARVTEGKDLEKAGGSSGDKEERNGRLMALKADVDQLGSTFRQLTKISFSKTNRLSRELDYFFSVYFPEKVLKKSEYRDQVYTIFAGGDDIFLIGRYDKIWEIAKELGKQFRAFTLGKATISIGLAMFSPHIPVTAIAREAEEAEQLAKGCQGCIDWRRYLEEVDNLSGKPAQQGHFFSEQKRDGIAAFGIPMKFPEFLEIEREWEEILSQLRTLIGQQKENIPSSFFFKLLKIVEMAEEVESKDFSQIKEDKLVVNGEVVAKREDLDYRNALWQSKLVYLMNRNFPKKGKLEGYGEVKREEVVKRLRDFVRKYRKKVIPSIQITLYKRRDGLLELNKSPVNKSQKGGE